MSIKYLNFYYILDDNNSMNTVKEILSICDEKMKRIGITRAELLRRIGQSPTLFNMAEKRNSYFNIETFVAISKELEISLPELLGLENNNIPEDIKIIEEMLIKLPLKDRKMISLIVKTYYDGNWRKNTN